VLLLSHHLQPLCFSTKIGQKNSAACLAALLDNKNLERAISASART
jgi:hypothetical protein